MGVGGVLRKLQSISGAFMRDVFVLCVVCIELEQVVVKVVGSRGHYG